LQKDQSIPTVTIGADLVLRRGITVWVPATVQKRSTEAKRLWAFAHKLR